MKQIIPFRKDVAFKTKVTDITSISLEHTLNPMEDQNISGEFLINGEYKMTDVSFNNEPFDFKIPFDIDLDDRYDIRNASVDIDDFYYEIINDEILRLSIDVCIDDIEEQEIEEEPIEIVEEVLEDEIQVVEPIEEIREEEADSVEVIEEINEEIEEQDEDIPMTIEVENTSDSDDIRNVEIVQDTQEEPRDTFDKEAMVEAALAKQTTDQVELEIEKQIENTQQDTAKMVAKEVDDVASTEQIKSLFDSFDDSSETFEPYRVYIVREEDTLESIMAKYSIDLDSLRNYNNCDEIKLGDKLIIPSIRSNE